MNEANRHNGWMGWLRRPVAILSWATALLMAGLWVGRQIPIEWVPRVELPEVHIAASWPGAAPRQVEQYVTAPIERAVQRVPGTAHVESLSEEGRATIILQVAPNVPLGPYVAQVREELARLRGVLPDRVVSELTRAVPEQLRDQQGFLTLQLVGPLEPEALRRMADEFVAPRLRSVPGVAFVRVAGGRERELLITLDPDRLEAYGLAPARVQQQLADALRDRSYGRWQTGQNAWLLFTPPETNLEAIRNLVLHQAAPRAAPVRLRDVARVELGPAPPRSISRVDGQPVVTLVLDRKPGSHLLTVADAVHATVEQIRMELPDDVRLLVVLDRSEDVRRQLRELLVRGGLGFALLVLVLLALLQSVRACVAVLFSVGVAVAVALLLFRPLGLTLNLITLAGMALVAGLLVDNSVVVVEQLLVQRKRLRARGLRGLALDAEATRRALQTVWLPLLGGTLTTMIVALPLVYLSGELRTLFLPFGVLVALTLGASLASAVLVVPVLGRFLPTPPPVPARQRRFRQLIALPYRLAARWPRLTLLVLFLVVGIPLWILPDRWKLPGEDEQEPTDNQTWRLAQERLARLYNATLGHDQVIAIRQQLEPLLGGVLLPFFQKTTFGRRWHFEIRPEVYVYMAFPPGTPIGRADTLMRRFEAVALASPSVARTVTQITEQSAYLRVRFTKASLRTVEPYLVRERLIQQAVQLAGLRYLSVTGLLEQGYYSGSGIGIAEFRIAAYGPSYEDLEAVCAQLAQRLKAATPRVAAVNYNVDRYGRPDAREVLQFRWTPEAQLRTGLTAGDLAAALRPVFNTRFPFFRAPVADAPYLPIRIEVAGAHQIDVARLITQPLPVTDSVQVQLAALAPPTIVPTPSAIERFDQQYRRYISVDFRGPWRLGDRIIRQVVESMPLPPGYRLQYPTYYFFGEQELKRTVRWMLPLTIALVFLIAAMVFESWRLPLVMLLSLPMAAVGVAVGFLWSEANFAEGAFIGLVLLAGIAVNDSLLLLDRFRQLRHQRPHGRPDQLVRLAVRERLRPMWTTTLSSIVALLPLLIFPDEEGFWLGLAVTVIGGLLASTLLAPLATVALISRRKS
ncbi:efflux RND transporter permease subunit [Rhodothermus profundi]|uniref:Multidrug efflux pump subunit AcrB n=1 Tax=Rhodothermus profundi TaxID=633813 RepID=A0A1M6UGC6_9BACT|nr:efflux RND transporter permease subunit [Rhodothermus profundi]SHK68220.1 Multidrug efflux pump subunit AcrB [Rhodothermus profundi]